MTTRQLPVYRRVGLRYVGVEKNQPPLEAIEEPRFLTKAEIDQIINSIFYGDTPLYIKMAGPQDSPNHQYVREDMIKYIRASLTKRPLLISKIEELTTTLISIYYYALIENGTGVGYLAGESVGTNATQKTLNSFHSSGSSKSQMSAIDVYRYLIFVRKKRKNPMTKIFFKKEISFTEVLNSRADIIASYVSAYVKDYMIGDFGDETKGLEVKWWHNFGQVPKEKKVLRLFFNVEELYKYRIYLWDIQAALERDAQDSIIVTCGPYLDGIIDIFPGENINKYIGSVKCFQEAKKERQRSISDYDRAGVDETFLEILFLKDVVFNCLKTLRVKGIKDISALEPDSAVITKYLEKDDSSQYWQYRFDQREADLNGITPTFIARLFRRNGLGDITYNKRSKIIGTSLLKSENPTNPLEVLSDNKENPPQVNYAITNGINMESIFKLGNIDTTRIISNDTHEIYRLFGIEAARTFLLRELYATTGDDIHPVHILFIVAYLTHTGVPKGVNLSGIGSHNEGPLYQATIAKAGEIFTKAAPLDKKENLSNTSAAIIAGARISIGTGSFDVGYVATGVAYNNDIRTAALKQEPIVLPEEPTVEPVPGPTPAEEALLASNSLQPAIIAINKVSKIEIKEIKSQFTRLNYQPISFDFTEQLGGLIGYLSEGLPTYFFQGSNLHLNQLLEERGFYRIFQLPRPPQIDLLIYFGDPEKMKTPGNNPRIKYGTIPTPEIKSPVASQVKPSYSIYALISISSNEVKILLDHFYLYDYRREEFQIREESPISTKAIKDSLIIGKNYDKVPLLTIFRFDIRKDRVIDVVPLYQDELYQQSEIYQLIDQWIVEAVSSALSRYFPIFALS